MNPNTAKTNKTASGQEWNTEEQAGKCTRQEGSFPQVRQPRFGMKKEGTITSVEVKEKEKSRHRQKGSEKEINKNKSWVKNVDCHGPTPALIFPSDVVGERKRLSLSNLPNTSKP